MAVHWGYMLESFEAAPNHLQVQVSGVGRASNYVAHVRGTVARVFEGDADLVGTDITLELACLGEEGGLVIGGNLARSFESLGQLRVVEVFLPEVSTEPVAPPYSYLVALDRPTDEPSFDLPAELAAMRAAEKEVRRARRIAAVASLVRSAAYLAAIGMLCVWLADPVASPRGLAWWGWLATATALMVEAMVRWRKGDPVTLPWVCLAAAWTITLINEWLLFLQPP